MADVFDVGDLVRVRGTWTDPNNGDAAVDPSVVKVGVFTPLGTFIEKTFGTDAEVIKDSVGVYHYDIDVDEAGIWYYRWHSTGTGQAAEMNVFTARKGLPT